MANPITPDQLVAALKKWQVRYQEYPGWRTRGRPGGILDARGIVLHHTGGGAGSDAYLEFLFVEGRPGDGIPGPLCNVATAPDGMLTLGAAGRANHAGQGSTVTMNHVQAEDYDGYRTELRPGPDNINGNPYYYGIEMIYTGTIPPTDAAYRSSVLYAAAVCDFHRWTALSVIGHREHTNRKQDPGYCPMDEFRRDLAAVLTIGPGVTWSGKTPQEDDMALTLAQERAIAKAGWLADQFAQGAQFETDIDEIQAAFTPLATKAQIDDLETQLAALAAAVTDLSTKVDQLVPKD